MQSSVAVNNNLLHAFQFFDGIFSIPLRPLNSIADSISLLISLRDSQGSVRSEIWLELYSKLNFIDFIRAHKFIKHNTMLTVALYQCSRVWIGIHIHTNNLSKDDNYYYYYYMHLNPGCLSGSKMAAVCSVRCREIFSFDVLPCISIAQFICHPCPMPMPMQ